jgi:hypothetical protein
MWMIEQLKQSHSELEIIKDDEVPKEESEEVVERPKLGLMAAVLKEKQDKENRRIVETESKWLTTLNKERDAR